MAYSPDFRKKVIEKYQSLGGKISYQKLSDNFGVSYCFVRTLILRWKKTGNTKKKPHGGGNPGKINQIKQFWLKDLITCYPDITLEELSERYKKQFFSSISTTSLYRALKKLKISRKKKASMILLKRR